MHKDQRVLNGLERELSLMARHYMATRQQRAGQVLDRSAYVLLSRLEQDRPRTLKELATAFNLDISTINRQVTALVRQDLAERIADPDGGVARKFRPTELGLQRLRSDRAQSREGVASIVTDWPPERVEEFLTLLTKFNVSIEELEGKSWPRPAQEDFS